MNKLKKCTFFLILSLLCLNNVSASCTNQEKENFKKIENNYKITYEYQSSTKKYTVTFVREDKSKYEYIIYTKDDLKCKDIDDKTSKCTNFSPGKYTIGIEGKTKTCNDELKTIDLNLPEYNKYYNDPLCKGIEEFVLCQETYDKEIDYETFKSRVETYKKTKIKEEENKNDDEENNPKTNNNNISNYINYIKDNIINIIIIATFIILLITTIIITVKQQRKSRRLE